MTHLIEVAGLVLGIPFIRIVLAMVVGALILDAHIERRHS